jgi:hypothetical protein
MIIVGWGGKKNVLGTILISDPCPNCSNVAEWEVLEFVQEVRMYFLPVARWGRKYAFACSICSHGYELPDRRKAQDMLLKNLEHISRAKINLAREASDPP